jgi:hypothetical protein
MSIRGAQLDGLVSVYDAGRLGLCPLGCPARRGNLGAILPGDAGNKRFFDCHIILSRSETRPSLPGIKLGIL